MVFLFWVVMNSSFQMLVSVTAITPDGHKLFLFKFSTDDTDVVTRALSTPCIYQGNVNLPMVPGANIFCAERSVLEYTRVFRPTHLQDPEEAKKQFLSSLDNFWSCVLFRQATHLDQSWSEEQEEITKHIPQSVLDLFSIEPVPIKPLIEYDPVLRALDTVHLSCGVQF